MNQCYQFPYAFLTQSLLLRNRNLPYCGIWVNKRYGKLKASVFSEPLPGKPNPVQGEFYEKARNPTAGQR